MMNLIDNLFMYSWVGTWGGAITTMIAMVA